MNDRAWVKKLAFVLGNPICCPATTYHKAVLGEPLYAQSTACPGLGQSCEAGRGNRDVLSAMSGLFSITVHEDATTKACIRDNRRFCGGAGKCSAVFWPEPVADIIMGFYKKAYGEYE